MTIGIYSIIGGILALVSGLVIGYLLSLFLTNKRISSASSRAENLLTEAKNKAQDLLLEAKNTSLKMLEDSKRVEEERHQQLVRIEGMLSKRELELDGRAKDMDRDRQIVTTKIMKISELKSELEIKLQAQNQELEKIAGLKKRKPEIYCLETLKKSQKELPKKCKFEQSNKEELERKAKDILLPPSSVTRVLILPMLRQPWFLCRLTKSRAR